jgi:hypothetical protein
VFTLNHHITSRFGLVWGIFKASLRYFHPSSSSIITIIIMDFNTMVKVASTNKYGVPNNAYKFCVTTPHGKQNFTLWGIYYDAMKYYGMTDQDIMKQWVEYVGKDPKGNPKGCNMYSPIFDVYSSEVVKYIRQECRLNTGKFPEEIGTPPALRLGYLNGRDPPPNFVITEFKHSGPKAVSYLDPRINEYSFMPTRDYLIIPPNEGDLYFINAYIQKTAKIVHILYNKYYDDENDYKDRPRFHIVLPCWPDIDITPFNQFTWHTMTYWSDQPCSFSGVPKRHTFIYSTL